MNLSIIEKIKLSSAVGSVKVAALTLALTALAYGGMGSNQALADCDQPGGVGTNVVCSGADAGGGFTGAPGDVGIIVDVLADGQAIDAVDTAIELVANGVVNVAADPDGAGPIVGGLVDGGDNGISGTTGLEVNVGNGAVVIGANSGIVASDVGARIIVDDGGTVTGTVLNGIDVADDFEITVNGTVNGDVDAINAGSGTGPGILRSNVTVGATGELNATAGDGIEIVNDVVVVMDGVINAGDNGIEAGSGNDITVGGTINADGLGIEIDDDNVVLVNGTINATDGILITGPGNSVNNTVTVGATGVVNATDDGIELDNADDNTIVVDGTVTASDSGGGTANAGILLDAPSTGNEITVNGAVTGEEWGAFFFDGAGDNELIVGATGSITGQLEDGVDLGDNNSLLNDGAISGGEVGVQGDVGNGVGGDDEIVINGSVVGGNNAGSSASGIELVEGWDVLIGATGTVEGVGTGGDSDGITLDGNGVGNTVTVLGAVTGADNGIEANEDNVITVNGGTVTGLSSSGIVLENDDNTVNVGEVSDGMGGFIGGTVVGETSGIEVGPGVFPSADGNDINIGVGDTAGSLVRGNTVAGILVGDDSDDTDIVIGGDAKASATGSTVTGPIGIIIEGDDVVVDNGGFIIGTAGPGIDITDTAIGTVINNDGGIIAGSGTVSIDGSVNDDTVTAEGGQFDGDILLDAGLDEIDLDDASMVNGSINSGDDADTVSLDGGTMVTGDVLLGLGDDDLFLGGQSNIAGSVDAGDGNDTVTIGDGSTTVVGGIDFGAGASDELVFDDGGADNGTQIFDTATSNLEELSVDDGTWALNVDLEATTGAEITGANVNDQSTLLVNQTLTTPLVNVNGFGVLGGTGTVDGDVDVFANGRINPGASGGELTIDGNLNVQNGGNLDFEVGGCLFDPDPACIPHDSLIVTGNADLQDGSNVNILPLGANINVGDSIVVMDVAGALNEIGGGATINNGFGPGITATATVDDGDNDQIIVEIVALEGCFVAGSEVRCVNGDADGIDDGLGVPPNTLTHDRDGFNAFDFGGNGFDILVDPGAIVDNRDGGTDAFILGEENRLYNTGGKITGRNHGVIGVDNNEIWNQAGTLPVVMGDPDLDGSVTPGEIVGEINDAIRLGSNNVVWNAGCDPSTPNVECVGVDTDSDPATLEFSGIIRAGNDGDEAAVRFEGDGNLLINGGLTADGANTPLYGLIETVTNGGGSAVVIDGVGNEVANLPFSVIDGNVHGIETTSASEDTFIENSGIIIGNENAVALNGDEEILLNRGALAGGNGVAVFGSDAGSQAVVFEGGPLFLVEGDIWFGDAGVDTDGFPLDADILQYQGALDAEFGGDAGEYAFYDAELFVKLGEGTFTLNGIDDGDELNGLENSTLVTVIEEGRLNVGGMVEFDDDLDPLTPPLIVPNSDAVLNSPVVGVLQDGVLGGHGNVITDASLVIEDDPMTEDVNEFEQIGGVFVIGEATGTGTGTVVDDPDTAVDETTIIYDDLDIANPGPRGTIAPGVVVDGPGGPLTKGDGTIGTLTVVGGPVIFDAFETTTVLIEAVDDPMTPEDESDADGDGSIDLIPTEVVTNWGGQLQADINDDGAGDRLNVVASAPDAGDGAVALAGNLDLLPDPEFVDVNDDGIIDDLDRDANGNLTVGADYTGGGYVITLIDAEGGVDGRFQTFSFEGCDQRVGDCAGSVVVQEDDPLTTDVDEEVRVQVLKAYIQYLPNQVNLITIPDFAPKGETVNQIATGAYIDSFTQYGVNEDPLHNAIALAGVADDMLAALDAMHPEWYNAFNEVGFTHARHGEQQAYLRAIESQANLGETGKVVENPYRKSVTVGQSSDGNRATFWIAGQYSTSDVDSGDGFIEYDYDTVGGFLGFDYMVTENILIGILGGYLDTDVDYDGRTGEGNVDSWQFGGYAAYVDTNWFAMIGGGYGSMDINSTRDVVFGSDAGTVDYFATADYDGDYYYFYGRGGYSFEVGEDFTLTPELGLTYTKVEQDAFSESGSDATVGSVLNLDVREQNNKSVRGTFQVRATKVFKTGNAGTSWLAYGRVGVAHEFEDDLREITANFQGAPGTEFTVFGEVPRETTVIFGVGASGRVSEMFSLFLDYSGEIGGDFSEHAITGGARIHF